MVALAFFNEILKVLHLCGAVVGCVPRTSVECIKLCLVHLGCVSPHGWQHLEPWLVSEVVKDLVDRDRELSVCIGCWVSLCQGMVHASVFWLVLVIMWVIICLLLSWLCIFARLLKQLLGAFGLILEGVFFYQSIRVCKVKFSHMISSPKNGQSARSLFQKVEHAMLSSHLTIFTFSALNLLTYMWSDFFGSFFMLKRWSDFF
ncbi:hypothetical protein ACFX16_000470 [Malus domestica]